jgi:hypothetical protein
MLALADLGAEFLGLFVGHPERGGVAPGESLGPEKQHVDAAVGNGVVTERAGDAPGGMFDAPWFHPGTHALFKLSRNLVRDAGVEILSVRLLCHVGTSLLLDALALSLEPESQCRTMGGDGDVSAGDA